MKKSVSITLSILGGLLLIMLLLPFLISLNQYKTMIQEKAFEATGRQILINGDIRFGILPSPYARLTDVVITNPEGAISQEFARVKALDVGVALAPLFSKQINVTHITVTEPAITMEVMENGGNNWQFTPQKTDDKTETVNQDDPSGSTAAISVDNLKIEKGFIRYVNVPGKSQQTVGPVDALFKIESLQGPVSGIGTATLMEKLHVRFDTKIAALPSADNKEIPFTFSLGILNNAATADLKGSAMMGDDVTARVETAVTIADLAKILAALNKDNKAPALPDYLQGRTSMTGLLEWKEQKAAIDNLMLKAGSMEVHGSVAASVKETLSVVIDLGRVALPPEAAQNNAAKPQTGKKSATNLAKTLQDGFAQATAFLDTSLPQNDVNLVLTAAQLPLPNQPVLRDVRVAASLSQKGLTLQNAEVKLPGNTHIKLRGTLPTRDDGKIDHVMLQADITSDNITAASGQTSGAEKMPIALNATTNLSRQMLRINPLNLSQKGQSVQGDVIYDPKSDPVLTVAIKGSALNLDGFMAGEKAPASKAATQQTAATKSSSDPLAMLQGLKAKLNVDLGAVTFQKKTAKNITAHALVSDQGLELQQASIGDLGGMVIKATGKVDRLSPLHGASLRAEAQTPNLSTTLKTLGNAEAANLGTSSFNLSVEGNDKHLEMVLNGTIDQGKLAISGKAANLTNSPSFNGKIDISHPETATILRNFAKMTPKISLGAFALQSEVAYGADTIKADKLLIKLGSAGALQGHVNITPDGNGRKIDADIRGDKLALSALMGDDNKTDAASVDTHNPNQAQAPWSREPINLDALRGMNGKANVEIGELLYQKFIVRDLKTTVVFADNNVNLQRLSGALFDAGTFNVQGQLAAAPMGQAHRGDFTIAINKTDAVKLFAAMGSKPFAKGVANINQTLKFSGASPYQLVSNLNGDGQIKVDDVIINGLDLDALADRLDRPNSIGDFAAIINQAAAGGQTAIGNLDIPVTIHNGVVSIADTTIKTQKTSMMLKGNVQLPPKQVDMTGQISFIEQRNLPPLTLFIKGAMNNPQKNFDTRGFTNFYAQKATEKLQDKLGEKIQDGLGKLLGTPKQPAANTPSGASSEATSGASGTSGVNTPVSPVAPSVAPSAAPSQAPASAPAAKQQQQDPLKQLGNEMLKNILGGGGNR